MGLGGTPLAVICLVLQILTFIFTVVMTPLDVFRYRHKGQLDLHPCYSMWGAKQCGPHGVTKGLSNKGFPCSKIRSTMEAASAFSILAIVVGLAVLILCAMLVCGCTGKPATIVLSIVSLLFLVIAFACQSGAYVTRCDGQATIKAGYHLGSSFAVLLTAWVLQFINCVLIMMI